MNTSVIIPAYNRLPVLKHCISSLVNQTFNDFEIILIDDCSTDGTGEYFRNMSFDKLRYVVLPEQKGPYYARNIGIERSKGELIIFLDSDVIVFPDFIEDHVKVHKRGDDIVLQGMVRHVDSIDDVSFNKFYIPNALCINTFITQNISVKKKWFEKVGGFEDFGPEMGYKDIDMGLKLKEQGLRWYYGIRRCKAFHIDGQISEESLINTFEKRRNQGASAYYFVKKWGKIGERYAHTGRALFFSKVLSTDRWIENDWVPRIMIKSKENCGIIWTVLKGVTRYHYRKRGIEEAMKNDSIGNCS